MSKLFAAGERARLNELSGKYSRIARWVDMKDGIRSLVIFPSSIRSSACDELVGEYNGTLTSCEWDEMIERISIL